MKNEITLKNKKISFLLTSFELVLNFIHIYPQRISMSNENDK